MINQQVQFKKSMRRLFISANLLYKINIQSSKMNLENNKKYSYTLYHLYDKKQTTP